MKHSEFAQMVQSGVHPVITFNEGINELEVYPQPGMQGRVIGAESEGEGDDTVLLMIDYTEFEEYNKQFEISNYYDKNGSACLTAREAGCYDVVEGIYTMSNQDVGEQFIATTDTTSIRLYDIYKQSGSAGSYVSWLEDTVCRFEKLAWA